MVFLRVFKSCCGSCVGRGMSSAARPSSGGGGGGIRGFFSKLRKPSDQFMQVQVGSRTFEAQELQKLIPQLEEAIQRKDQQLKAQQGTVENHIRRIAELEAEVTSLQQTRSAHGR
ncbi:hypothetical protein Y032_0345g3116 [Ancylostoma ceylanicum]|uniref:Uncharacterized protein n=1 Tax=Ancylostoma ceylanicum TaxID=53326 RepID=A0A016RXA1_9BILA|nr:hypothetical protein Y032_0345g3116 [Ancylostoma ceylanicum]